MSGLGLLTFKPKALILKHNQFKLEPISPETGSLGVRSKQTRLGGEERVGVTVLHINFPSLNWLASLS